MKLQLDPAPAEFSLDVTLRAPGGGESSARFTFVEMDQDALDACNGERRPDEVIVLRALKGWSGVVDGDGNELDYNSARAEALMRRPWVRYQVAQAYLREIGGLDRGN